MEFLEEALIEDGGWSNQNGEANVLAVLVQVSQGFAAVSCLIQLAYDGLLEKGTQCFHLASRLATRTADFVPHSEDQMIFVVDSEQSGPYASRIETLLMRGS